MVTTFVGREHELAVLAEVRARALRGRRQLVVVTGAAGIGKTWFCEQASAAAERDGFDVLWGRCWPHGGAAALWPWPAVLPALVGPAGARLLAADSGADAVDPERFARFAAVAELLAEARKATPTVIVIDDVHLADDAALLLTRFLAGTLDRLPMVIVLVRRDTRAPAEALLGELSREATTIPLRPFGVHETAALLAAHGEPAPAPDVAGALVRVTRGNPLYLARAVEQGWAGTEPATLEHAITDTLARLAAPARRIVAFAALLGPDGSPGEIASLVGESAATVVEALTAAAGAGLVEGDCHSFHDLVRQVAIAQLDTAELLDAHARAAALLAGRGQPERVAHHALAAAVRADADAELAITACRAAAASLFAGYAYEAAADLLGRAVALAEPRPDLARLAGLLVERADAVLASGRLTDARAAFETATEAAERSGDPVLFARAVLGLGGVWVQEHRNAGVRERVLARQRAALNALPLEESALRCRLTTRLAAEAVYEGGPVEPVLAALAAARATGDARTLAEALSLTHNTMLGPEHAARRLPLAQELIAVGSAAGDGILALFGLLWRTIDLYLLGNPDAERSLTELRQRSAAMGVATAHYVVVCVDVMREIRAGRLDEAEAAAEQCLRLGLEIGDADAIGCYGGQMVAIRWFQGRDAELADLVSDTVSSASLVVVEYGFRVSIALALARGGRLAEARAALQPLLDKGLANLPTSSTWLTAMVGVIESAWLLGETALAAAAASLVRPFADLPVMPSLAVSCFGSAARGLGRAALVTGDPAAAVEHLEHAVAANLRLGHRPATMLSRAELAEALTARAAPGDMERATTELALAVAEAQAMGLTHRVEMWTARLEPVVLSPVPDGWTVARGATRIELPDLVGLRYLARLLRRPGRELTAVELSDAVLVDDRHDLLDNVAVTAYRQRLRDLAEAIDDAESCADAAKAERLRQEQEAITAELARTIGLGGRLRQFSSTPERARTAVRKALTRAVDTIAAADPILGAELRTAISTGTVCRYTPAEGSRPWQVTQ